MKQIQYIIKSPKTGQLLKNLAEDAKIEIHYSISTHDTYCFFFDPINKNCGFAADNSFVSRNYASVSLGEMVDAIHSYQFRQEKEIKISSNLKVKINNYDKRIKFTDSVEKESIISIDTFRSILDAWEELNKPE